MLINEIFYSVQGEGARVGTPTVFIRFAKCNLACNYCDTEFESGVKMSPGQIAAKVKALMPEPRCVILTGGEPLLQYDEKLYQALRAIGVGLIAVETNGSVKPKAKLDYIACSPKVAEHVVAANFPNGVDELRYTREEAQGLPQPKVKAKHLFLSPIFSGGLLRQRNLDWCLELVKANPDWRLSVQLHKLIGER